MKITTKNGLLYRDGRLITLPEADRLARANGYSYAESLVNALLNGAIAIKDIQKKQTRGNKRKG
jgi:hypothetical protein